MGHYASEMMTDAEHKLRVDWYRLMERLKLIRMSELTVAEYSTIVGWLNQPAPGFDANLDYERRKQHEIRMFCESKGT